MAPTSTNNTSSIARALAGMTESVPIPPSRHAAVWAGKDSFAAVAARSAPTKNKTAGLPTPPNSLSPSLPPQAYKTSSAHLNNGPPTPPGPIHSDSDIDLEEAVQHAKVQDAPQRGLTAQHLGNLGELDAAGALTPSMLAKHHLPGILLQNGPLAIRHIMGFLTTSVPGFSGIPPAKARRLVVGALEGRGSDGQQGGIDGDVCFEKVGWGRWDACKRNRNAREMSHPRHVAPSRGLRIPIHSSRKIRAHGIFGSHQESEHAYDSHLDEGSMLEHEADKMSLDGASTCSSDQPSEDKLHLDLDMNDVTDEEDWASMGAAALRQGSTPGGLMPSSARSYQQQVEPKSRGRGMAIRPSSSSVAKSMPASHPSPVIRARQQERLQQTPPMIPEDVFRDGDARDREAVEALLKLSSF